MNQIASTLAFYNKEPKEKGNLQVVYWWINAWNVVLDSYNRLLDLLVYLWHDDYRLKYFLRLDRAVCQTHFLTRPRVCRKPHEGLYNTSSLDAATTISSQTWLFLDTHLPHFVLSGTCCRLRWTTKRDTTRVVAWIVVVRWIFVVRSHEIWWFKECWKSIPQKRLWLEFVRSIEGTRGIPYNWARPRNGGSLRFRFYKSF